jgi:diguanylate cyclase (GGDEF)-like protein
VLQSRRDRRVPADDRALLLAARRELDALRTRNEQLLREVEQLRRGEAQARRLAGHDELTGLCNRRLMLQSLAAAIDTAARTAAHVGLLFIDLDGFKAINDDYGHAAGDRLLTAVGARIAARARKFDVVCRYGGDEFVVVLPGVPDARAVAQIASQLRMHLSVPYLIQGAELCLTAAVGVAVFPDHALDAEKLLQRADESMYRAKAGGRAHSHPSAAVRRQASYAKGVSAATIIECQPTEVPYAQV